MPQQIPERHRLPEEVPLSAIAPYLPESNELAMAFYSLGNDRRPRGVGHGNDSGNGPLCGGGLIDPLDQRPVKLDGVERHSAKVTRQAQVQPEVVDGDRHAKLAHHRQPSVDRGPVPAQDSLTDLDTDTAPTDPGPFRSPAR